MEWHHYGAEGEVITSVAPPPPLCTKECWWLLSEGQQYQNLNNFSCLLFAICDGKLYTTDSDLLYTVS